MPQALGEVAGPAKTVPEIAIRADGEQDGGEDDDQNALVDREQAEGVEGVGKHEKSP
ncbi:MAG: hypothetical protein HND48_15895 [Chloroflexi bacterium]|nr:hypothetical protein [Chloroflexota bacterium]